MYVIIYQLLSKYIKTNSNFDNTFNLKSLTRMCSMRYCALGKNYDS